MYSWHHGLRRIDLSWKDWGGLMVVENNVILVYNVHACVLWCLNVLDLVSNDHTVWEQLSEISSLLAMLISFKTLHITKLNHVTSGKLQICVLVNDFEFCIAHMILQFSTRGTAGTQIFCHVRFLLHTRYSLLLGDLYLCIYLLWIAEIKVTDLNFFKTLKYKL